MDGFGFGWIPDFIDTAAHWGAALGTASGCFRLIWPLLGLWGNFFLKIALQGLACGG